VLRWFGIDREAERRDFRVRRRRERVGYKFHMNDARPRLVASIEIVGQLLNVHRENAAYYGNVCASLVDNIADYRNNRRDRIGCFTVRVPDRELY